MVASFARVSIAAGNEGIAAPGLPLQLIIGTMWLLDSTGISIV